MKAPLLAYKQGQGWRMRRALIGLRGRGSGSADSISAANKSSGQGDTRGRERIKGWGCI